MSSDTSSIDFNNTDTSKKMKTKPNSEDSKQDKTVKRKYIRKTRAKDMVTREVSNLEDVWDLVNKSYSKASTVIVIVPPKTPVNK